MDGPAGAIWTNEAEVRMSELKHWYLISYDVRDDKRLRRVAKHMEGYGDRIQLSVFRCRLNKRDIERLKWELTQKMDTEDDLLIIQLCHRCSDRIVRRNVLEQWSEKVTTFEIV
jgi:CRISPR-associated protein Cas2